MSDSSNGNDMINKRFATYHLTQAICELANILTASSFNEEFDMEKYASSLAHAYDHINWAWNGRNRSDKTRVDFSSDLEMREMAKFPTDLAPLLTK